jgi:hypothetical protein
LLSFRWSSDPKLDLQLCFLDITVGDETQTCSLNNPVEAPAVQLRFDEGEQNVDLRLSDSLTLKLDLRFEGAGFGDVQIKYGGTGLKRGDKRIIRIPDPNGIGEFKHVQIQVEFLAADSNNDLRFKAYGFPRFIEKPSNVNNLVAKLKLERTPDAIRAEQVRKPLDNTKLQDWENICKVALASLKSAKDRHANLLKTLETKGKIEHDAAIAAYRSRLNAGNKPKSEKDKMIQREDRIYGNRVGWRKEEAERLEEYGKLVTENAEWCNNMETLLDKIHDSGRIHFRVYVEREGRQLELVRSKEQ